MLKTKQVDVTGEGSATLSEMNAACFVDVLEARENNKSEIEVAAIVCRHCIVEWRQRSVAEILENYTTEELTRLMNQVVTLTDRATGKNSEAGQRASSS